MSWQLLFAVILAWAIRECRYWSSQRTSAAKADLTISRRLEELEASGTNAEGGEELDSEESTVVVEGLEGGTTGLAHHSGECQGKEAHILDKQAESGSLIETRTAKTEHNVGSTLRAGLVQEKPEHSDTLALTPSDRSRVLGQQAVAISGGFFNNSHDLVFNNSVMYNIQKTTERVLLWLAGYTLPEAEFDSSLRDPPPRCHPGTRIDIRQMILQWIDNSQRTSRLLWLRGAAGVGKSAIVQTLTEELWSASKLGAAFFFSRPNKLRNPIFVFPTLAYQIAVRLPAYRAYLEERMAENPKILEKGIERQFHILFVSPFSVISEAQAGRLTVFVDGLDECDDSRAQTLIVRLIASFTLHHPVSPLVWVIASRPEVHLNTVFESAEVASAVWAHDVPSNGDKASHGVEKYLRDNFQQIQSKHQALIHEHASWPVEQDITQICSASSGNYALASTIIRVIDDRGVNDPISQLQVVLSITASPHSDPLLTLYALYTKVFDAVPKVLLPSLKLVLTYHLLASKHLPYDFRSSLVLIATLFGLEKDIVYGGLRKLQSVVEYPSHEKAGTATIWFRHASFSDYLQDTSLSGEYAIFTDSSSFDYEVWQGCIRVIKKYSHHATPWSDLEFAWWTNPPYANQCDFWKAILEALFSFLLESPTRKPGEDTSNIHALPSTADICATFQVLDFTRLAFESRYSLKRLYVLSRQLFGKPSHILTELGLVEKVKLRDLDRTRIMDKKLAFRASIAFPRDYKGGVVFPWRYSADTRDPYTGELLYDPEGDPLGTHVTGLVLHFAQWPDHNIAFSNSPDVFFHSSWTDHDLSIEPCAKLCLELERLHRSNPDLHVLLFGRDPSRSCALICAPPTSSKPEMFYYIPYAR